MSTDTEIDEAAPTARPDEGTPGRFARPGKTPDEQARLDRITTEREDEPPSNVPRDRYDQPIIVLPDGSLRAYRRASKHGGRIEDEYGINQWGKRCVVYGMSRAHHLVVRAQAVRTLDQSSEDIAALQDIADRADIIAAADAGAVTGTGLHKLSERQDAGEDLSWLDPNTAKALEVYQYLMAPFRVLATELFVILDELGAAGTLDRAVMLLVDLEWPDGVVIPAGTILIIDIKTGKISSAQYWASGYTVQQLVYATGTPYRPGVTLLKDPKKRSVQNIERIYDQPGDHGRISWDEVGVPGGPSQRWALILHVPALDPTKAKWERVDLDVARGDAEASRAAWERARVKRADRFATLPDNYFDVALTRLAIAGTDDSADSADTADTPPVDSPPSTDKVNDQLVAILLERIYRADRIDMITQIYDAWGASPSWTDAHGTACEEMIDRLTEPEDVITCDGCNYDRHTCPSCGVGVPHGKDVCRACELRLLLTDAPDVETLDVLYAAHAPEAEGGDGLWREGEHDAAAQARYDELTAAPPVDIAGPPTVTRQDLGEAPADSTGPGYPCTVEGATLWCVDCIAPGEDPRPWCDCQPGETCMDAAVACRQRAHEPTECAAYVPDEPTTCAEHGPHPDTILCQGCIDDSRRATAVAQQGAAEGTYVDEPDEPGPFDATLSLAELREAIDRAESTADVDALYEAHKATEEGGTGIWDDECTTRAQAAYDRLSASTVPS